jgi:hypothetical protein
LPELLRTSLLLLFLSLCGPKLHAQVELPWHDDVWRDDFSNFVSARYFTGSATRHDAINGRMILTPAQAAQSGRIVLRRLLPLSSFDVSMRASFGVGGSATNGGGDGMVFVFGPLDNWPEGGGGTLGFNGSLGYGVEFDTYQNPEYGDPTHEHIAVIKDVSSNHLRYETLAIPTLEDGRMHTLHIRLREKTVSVWIDGQRRLNHTITDFTDFEGYLSVTAACGSAFNEHILDDIRVTMPSRTSMAFGPYRYCAPMTIDTSIIVTNDHDFGNDLTITGISLLPGTPGVISLPAVPLPSVLPWRGKVAIPVRMQLPGEGSWQAVLRLDSDGGETVYDTLRVSAYTPRLTWSLPQLVFDPQPVGSLRDTVVYLINSGMVEAEVLGFSTSATAVTLSTTSPFPLYLQPGDSIAVRVSVRPATAGVTLDSAIVSVPCGVVEPLPLQFTGVLERIVMSFTRPALMLIPGGNGALALSLDTLPAFTPVYTVEGTYRYTSPELRFTGIVNRGAGLPTAATLTVGESSAGTVQWRVSSPAALQSTGVLAEMQFVALSDIQGCHDVTVVDATANLAVPAQEAMPVDAANGRICINASCRHPEGLRYTAPPDVRVYPNPFSDHSNAEISIYSDGQLEVFLSDMLGRVQRNVFNGYAEAGTLLLPLRTSDAPAGMYFLHIHFNGMRAHSTVIVQQ